MNTTLHWPSLSWFWSAWPRRGSPTAPRVRDRDTDLDELADLDLRILRDIGAPEPLLSRALARRDACDQRLDELRLGSASGGWRHW
ncbi:MAG: hypothetical protein ABI887_19850 [Burkholderiales bacterium]